MNRKSQRNLIVALTAIFLALTYVCLGYAVCAGIPQVTEKVAWATIDDSNSPFDESELVSGAVASRDYSFGSHDVDALYRTISDMNQKAQTPYADASQQELMQAPDEYSIGQDALAHLDDVYDVSSSLMFPILGIACIAAFLLMAGLRQFGAQPVARALFWSGIVLLGVMVTLGIWALVSFDSMFTLMHSLLFTDGSWTFPADSLLITMLPESFWIGMALTWIAISALLAAASLVIGIILGRKYAPARK